VSTENEITNPWDLPKGNCSRCQTRKATSWWLGEGSTMDFVHGMGVPYCERCTVEEQLTYARKMVDRIPELEKRLAGLP
jgi:hypothetical protein